MKSSNGIGEIPEQVVGVPKLDSKNKELARKRLEKHFAVKRTDAVVFVDPEVGLDDEIEKMIQKHEYAMGITPMKIFLSHKGADKPLVREYKHTLELLGFDPWLDEDSMHAGEELERSLFKGFNDSCAAVFLVTPNYSDENYLASEIDYAIQEKRSGREVFDYYSCVRRRG